MAATTGDEILKKLNDIETHMADEFKSRDEKLAEVEGEAKKALDDLQKYRRETAMTGAPLDDEQMMGVNQRGGIFGGKFKVPYEKMLSLSTRTSCLNSTERERLTAIQDLHDAVVLRYWMLNGTKKPGKGDDWVLNELYNSLDFQMYATHLVGAGYFKAPNDILNPGGGTGTNLDFTLLSSQLIDLIRIDAVVASQFPTVTLTRANQEFPALRSDAKGVLGGGVATGGLPRTDADNITAGPPANARVNPTFGKVAFAAVHCLGMMSYDDDMLEDSIVPIVPILRSQASIMIARAKDAAVINGDDSGTHQDTDTTDAFDFRKAWDGLRKLGENYESTIGAAISSGDFNTLMQLMGKYATNPNALTMFINVTDWLILAADTNLQTVDKVGIDRATLRQGVINQVFGVNIVVSEEVRRDLNVAGVYDGVTTNNTVEILCNTSRFWFGEKNTLDIEQVRVPQALANWIQADLRVDFQAIDKESSDNVFLAGGVAPVAIGVDVTAA